MGGHGRRHKTETGEARVEGEAETNMPFFVLNSWPTLFSVTQRTVFTMHTGTLAQKESSVFTHTSYSTYTTFARRAPCTHTHTHSIHLST